MADAAYGSLPFREQSEFFARKVNLPTTSWTDVYSREHDWAFVVAGANRDAIVSDFRQAVQKAIDQGTTLEEFRQDFDAIVARHGWDYNGGRDWRSRVIYDNNLNSSYAAGRYQQLQAAPYWEYEHQDWVQHPRPHHVAWNGLILARDDPWWQTHFPPNGWGCQCQVRGRWDRDLRRLGKSGPDQAPAIELEERTIGTRSPRGPQTVQVPSGIDPGWDHAPGASRLDATVPPRLPWHDDPPGVPNNGPTEPLPPPARVPATVLLPEPPAPADTGRVFLQALNTDTAAPSIVRDVLGERVVVGPGMFTDSPAAVAPSAAVPAIPAPTSALTPAIGQALPLLARLLSNPDEVWARVLWLAGQGSAVVVRRYLGRFEVVAEDGSTRLVSLALERSAAGWAATVDGDIEDRRLGALLYRRDE